MQSALVNVSTSGDHTIVNADGNGRRIRVTAYKLTFAGTVTAQWWSGPSASGTQLDQIYGAAGMDVEAAPMPPRTQGGIQQGRFETAGGQALVLNLSGAVAVGGHVVFEYVS